MKCINLIMKTLNLKFRQATGTGASGTGFSGTGASGTGFSGTGVSGTGISGTGDGEFNANGNSLEDYIGVDGEMAAGLLLAAVASAIFAPYFLDIALK